jgi:hypothetical protein
VNSASQGPYGDALNYELLPLVESRFRAIGQGWARALYGGSTGGWESLAVQVSSQLMTSNLRPCPPELRQLQNISDQCPPPPPLPLALLPLWPRRAAGAVPRPVQRLLGLLPRPRLLPGKAPSPQPQP